MTYHPNPHVDNVIQTLLDDELGDSCGMPTHLQAIAAHSAIITRANVRQCAATIHERLTEAEIAEAGDIVRKFYDQQQEISA